MKFQHESIFNPITALQFYQKKNGTLLLLSGEGPYLKVYDVSAITTFTTNASRLLSQCQIFNDQIIHGIVVREHLKDERSLCVVIWGGTHLALLTKVRFDILLDTHVEKISDNVVTTVPDWILDVSISPHHTTICALVTAHNVVLKVCLNKFEDDNDQVYLEEAISSPIKLILYSANLIWESPSLILVVSGTVFGEIISWKFHLENDRKIVLLSSFRGHEGSIFGVNISPIITHVDGRVGRLLASCSDDRTVRVWDLTMNPEIEKNNSVTTFTTITDSIKPVMVEEMGFGLKDKGALTPVTGGQVASIMGHASRIWRVKFLLSDQGSSARQDLINLLSFGEDATTHQWALRLSEPHLSLNLETKIASETVEILPFKDQSFISSTTRLPELNFCRMYEFHSGKHIWSSALCRFQGRDFLTTGGADGKISLFNVNASSGIEGSQFEQREKEVFTNAQVLDLNDIFSVLKSSSNSHREKMGFSKLSRQIKPRNTEIEQGDKYYSLKDNFNRYTFVSETEFLVTTNLGYVICGFIIKDSLIKWLEVPMTQSSTQDLRSYAVIEGFPELGIAFLSGKNGTIFEYVGGKSKSIIKVGKVEGKVADMFRIFDKDSKFSALLVTTLHSKIATMLYIDNISHFSKETSTFSLPLDKFVVTSAGIVNGLIIFGSRSGLLAIYEPKRPEIPLEVCKGIDEEHDDAITSIVPLLTQEKSKSHIRYFVTTSRNGIYSIFSIASILEQSSNCSRNFVQVVHRGNPPIGPMIENAWFDETQELLIYGFRGKNFIVWNESKQCEILRVNCGGAHRSYTYISLKDQKGGYFIYTKASKLHFIAHRFPSHQVVKQGGHGREIKTCAISQDKLLIATGAEDTLIRIWRHDMNEEQETHLQCQTVVRKHTTGIQHLQWIGSRYLFSSGGNEEFFVWVIHSIPSFGVGIVCESSFPGHSEKKDLRITCFDIIDISNSYADDFNVLINLCFSDSSLRSYMYSLRHGFSPMAAGKYTSSCITQIRNFHLSIDQLFIVTAATDGVIALWIAENTGMTVPQNYFVDFKLLSAKKLHQSTVKSLELYSNTKNIFISTGGDDGALGILIYDFYGLRDPPSAFLLDSAHAAAITSISFVPLEPSQSLWVISSSNDQQVKVWKFENFPKNDPHYHQGACSSNFSSPLPRFSDLEIYYEKGIFTSVADIGDMIVFPKRNSDGKKLFNIMVVGNGMDIYEISNI